MRIIIFLDDRRSMGVSRKKLLVARDTLIFLLQNLRFLINFQKSVLNPTSTLEFLGALVNPQNTKFGLPTEKVRKLQEIQNQPSISIRTLSKLEINWQTSFFSSNKSFSTTSVSEFGTSTNSGNAFAGLPGGENHSFRTRKVGTELMDIQLKFCNGKCLIISPAQLIISSDASSQSWGASCQKKQTGSTGQRKRGNST